MNKDTNNIYKTARIKAGLKREPAAEELHVDVRTLDKYEALGGKAPDDIVRRMCILYDNNYLAYQHLKKGLLGEFLPDIENHDFRGATLEMISELDSIQTTVKKFIDRVTGDIALIDTQEHKDEIFVEYKKDLDVSKAITSVKRRYEAIEAERKRREEAEARAKAEAEQQRTVDEAVERHQAEEAENAPEAAPVSAPIEEVEPAEKLYNVSFDFSKRLRLLNVSRAQAVRARQELNDKINSFINEYLSEEGIEYEYIQSANG